LLASLSHDERVALYGHIPFKAAPTQVNPEKVRVPLEWSLAHMREVMIPQLADYGIRHSVTFHYKVAKQAAALWAAWEEAGLLDEIESWDGSWVTRFKRQTGTIAERLAKVPQLNEFNLSNHAWGTAFDINAAVYPLGTPRNKVSSGFMELVPIAERFGFAWGGDFRIRPDPMHFEVSRVIS
jgi:hypothetical protein